MVSSASNNGLSEMAEDRAQLDPVANDCIIMGQTRYVTAFTQALVQVDGPNRFGNPSPDKIKGPESFRGRIRCYTRVQQFPQLPFRELFGPF